MANHKEHCNFGSVYLDQDIVCDVALVCASAHALHHQMLLLPELCVLELWRGEELNQLSPVLAGLEVGEPKADLGCLTFAICCCTVVALFSPPLSDIAEEPDHLHLPLMNLQCQHHEHPIGEVLALKKVDDVDVQLPALLLLIQDEPHQTDLNDLHEALQFTTSKRHNALQFDAQVRICVIN